MINRELLIDVFTSPSRIEAGTLLWGERYSGLLSKLGELGTEVQRVRTLITNQDKPPHHFIGSAGHIFVFPPQTVAAMEDSSHSIDERAGYEVQQESIESAFDESLVDGVLRIYYDDSDNRVEFRVMGDIDTLADNDSLLAVIDQALNEDDN